MWLWPGWENGGEVPALGQGWGVAGSRATSNEVSEADLSLSLGPGQLLSDSGEFADSLVLTLHLSETCWRSPLVYMESAQNSVSHYLGITPAYHCRLAGKEAEVPGNETWTV